VIRCNSDLCTCNEYVEEDRLRKKKRKKERKKEGKERKAERKKAYFSVITSYDYVNAY
jgi:hypothetical protein